VLKRPNKNNPNNSVSLRLETQEEFKFLRVRMCY